MYKKEDVAVKITAKNAKNIVKVLEKYGQDIYPPSKEALLSDDPTSGRVFEFVSLSFSGAWGRDSVRATVDGLVSVTLKELKAILKFEKSESLAEPIELRKFVSMDHDYDNLRITLTFNNINVPDSYGESINNYLNHYKEVVIRKSNEH